MPSLGYKRQFVAPIKALTKPHTIRAKRKHPIKPGDRLYMFTDMRQKTCEKIGEADCSKVERIRIYSVHSRKNGGCLICFVVIGAKRLTIEEAEALAAKDGFSTVIEFFRFFSDTHGKRFEGNLIHWQNFEPAKP